jgi:hypothetical protein
MRQADAGLVLGEFVISYHRETLSARIVRLNSLEYTRYSIFFNQVLTEVGPSHILISKRVVIDEYKWVCEERSSIQDEELSWLVGREIDKYFQQTNL